jgi:steroid delta-isomerase-like uncharacterized protein
MEKEIARNFYESYNEKNLDKSFEKYVANDLIYHSPYGSTREWWISTDKALFPAFSDFTVTILDQVAERRKVVTRLLMRGTHTDDFLGIPSNGKEASLEIVTIDRIENGKIAEHWFSSDFSGFLQQLATK